MSDYMVQEIVIGQSFRGSTSDQIRARAKYDLLYKYHNSQKEMSEKTGVKYCNLNNFLKSDERSPPYKLLEHYGLTPLVIFVEEIS